MASVWLCQLDRSEGLRKLVSLSIKMLIMRMGGGEGVLIELLQDGGQEDEVGQA